MATSSIPQLIANAAAQYGVDPSLALNVAIAESALNPSAVSSAGAIGVFQLMPATAAGLGVNPNNLQENIQGGVQYLGQLLAQFGNPTAALAAYNWGPGNVSQAQATYGDDWLSHAPTETQNYVTEILGPQAAFTPTLDPVGAVVSTASDIFDQATDAASDVFGGLTMPQLAMLAGGGLILYLLLGELLD